MIWGLLLAVGVLGDSFVDWQTISSIDVPLNLHPILNNRGTSFGNVTGEGMHNGSTYPAQHLPSGQWVHDGVTFNLPLWGDGYDNVKADGQMIWLESDEIAAIHILCAGEGAGGFNLGNTHEELGIVFHDGSVHALPLLVKTWWAHHWTNKGAIRTPFQYDASGNQVYNASHIFHSVIHVPPSLGGKRAVALSVPKPREHNSLHVFAITVQRTLPGITVEERVVAPFVRATRRWEEVGGDKRQIVQVAVRNPLSSSRYLDPNTWVDREISVGLNGDGFRTVRAGRVARLMPGDEVVVDVLIMPTGAATQFSTARVKFSLGDLSHSTDVTIEGAGIVHDFTAWSEDPSDIEQHSSPEWYNSAKFGIFIHWGLFSVPAWAPIPRYAEWYDFWIHDDKPGMPAYEHHLSTYGPDFVYDDFIPMFGAERFNATEWVDVIAASGAKYFVFTTKHHDGYALFDTGETSHRNSLRLGPKRDFLRELMDAAKREHPKLKRGTYFSMPEWFNPLYKPHGRVSFPGGPAYNPFKPGEVEPYTGFVDVGDYITGIQLPQMSILAEEYDTELMWCDIGLDNASATFVAEWYGAAAAQGRQVAISNRCGIGGDFDTPEMEKFNAVEMNKWETCASMDPYSFGYSNDTRDDEYRNATDIIHTLVDITAKGGNFLLNIGPKADGSIKEAITRPLREVGAWLRLNGRAIYDTFPFPLLPEVIDDGVHVQFTRNADSFFIISVIDLPPIFTLTVPLPILPCDQIVFVAPDGDVPVPWSYSNGELSIDLRGVDSSAYSGRIAYVFQVSYRECEQE